jgi:HK97 family phage major capsid protein
METKNLKELRSLRAEKEVEADALLEEGKLEEGKDVLQELKEINARIEAVEEEIKKLKEEGTKEDEPKKEDAPVADKGEQRSMNQFKPSIKENKESAEVRALAEFIKTKGETRAGLVSDDVGVLIPEDITYEPDREVKTVQNLADFVNKVQVKSASGKHPVKNRATAKFHTVAELEANPQLAKPDFREVPYEVATYRGSIPLTNSGFVQ